MLKIYLKKKKIEVLFIIINLYKKIMDYEEWGWFVREDAPYLPMNINYRITHKKQKLKRRLDVIEEEADNSASSFFLKLDNKYDLGNIFAHCFTCFTCIGLFITFNISMNITNRYKD